MSFKNVVIIQPPLVQLNTAYPSGAYLYDFFNKEKFVEYVKWYDFSNGLFNEIFSKDGLTKLFDSSIKNAQKLADKFDQEGNDFASYNLRRYICTKDSWIEWIDVIKNILCDGSNFSSREDCHKFVFSPFAPRGMRMENYLENLDHDISTDDARYLASMALADLADYISVVYDENFSLIRYAESIAVNETSFSQIENKIDSPVLTDFYETLLRRKFLNEEFKNRISACPALICVSVPFAGTFEAALYTGRFFKKNFGNQICVSFGGGFVNTELRDCSEINLNKYLDFISFDRGYGSYKNLIDLDFSNKSAENKIYKLRQFKSNAVIEPDWNSEVYEKYENECTCFVVPDFSDIDFSKYPRMIDDVNPMQRLWSDGSWFKAYLAHGCYWHKCAFCDVTLDYVRSFKITAINQLFESLYSQAEQKKIFGVHFVDEAMPPVSMIEFSKLNCTKNHPLSYWGNIRFEKTFNYDNACFLGASGLIGVSGGIEIATGSGLDSIHKGTDIDSIVSACCSFKEAGVLIHAYMIYGYYGETDQDTINSMETLRQFYEIGLLDSCFWHKFVLTRHSRIYSEYLEGKYPDLNPYEPKKAGVFAKNGLHFKDENKSEKFGPGLNAALNSWMHGDKLKKNVQSWFDFKTPAPSIPKDYVQKAVQRYEKKKEERFNQNIDLRKTYWLGSDCIISNGTELVWFFMGEEYRMNLKNAAKDISSLLKKLRPQQNHDELSADVELLKKLKLFRGKGLVCL